MNIKINKDKSIGKVLYIVEGNKTEPYILRKIFTKIFNYQYETLLREKKYKKYNSKVNPFSQVFVINTEESNIKFIDDENKFLDELFSNLIENYDFDIDNAAIYYLFDRDNKSNTNTENIKKLLSDLENSRENDGYLRQGLLLLSYPSVEAFTLSNFKENSFEIKIDTGNNLKQYLHENLFNHQNISEKTLKMAAAELLKAIEIMNIDNYDLDKFSECNLRIFDYEENVYSNELVYHVLSLICISLIDLGLIEIEDLEVKIPNRETMDVLKEVSEHKNGPFESMESLMEEIKS